MSQTRSLWVEGQEPGRQVIVLGVAVALTTVVLDLFLSGRLSLFFDLCFIVLCLGLALLVRPGDFFTVGILPPLIMLAVFLLLAAVAPGTVADERDGVVQAVISGLFTHATSLAVGYVLALAALAVRTRQLPA
ncbi:DUF6542 domain-containing protein [Nocardioides pacificus]